jgi:hypothetical protein
MLRRIAAEHGCITLELFHEKSSTHVFGNSNAYKRCSHTSSAHLCALGCAQLQGGITAN